MVHLPWV
jgi:hypothetical protein